jgi:hypothetical protein
METFEIGDRVYSKFAWSFGDTGEGEVIDISEYSVLVRYDDGIEVWENQSDMRKVK